MKNFVFGLFLVLIVWSLDSCATSASIYRPLSEVPNAEVLGSISCGFYAGGTDEIGTNERAYTALLGAAKTKYEGSIDVRNISWSYVGGFGKGTTTYIADGVVIRKDLQANARNATAAGVEGALARAANETLKNVPARSKIAIVYITAQDRSTTEYVAGELEYIWVNAGYIIIDRSQLDRIRREQNFQMSGEVDDNTAVSIGKIIGANIIVTGRVDGEGNLRRLRLRALDTQTAQVVGVSSEKL